MDNLYTLDEALDYLNETNFTEKIKESISSLIRKWNWDICIILIDCI